VIPFFIGGTGRSGTTILLQYLNKHSKISASNQLETPILTDMRGLLDLYENKNINSFENYIYKMRQSKEPYYNFLKSVEDQKINSLINDLKNNFDKAPKASIANFYFSFFESNNDYMGDSTPLNIQNAHRIDQAFDNSKFIHIFRDGRDSGYSVYEMMRDTEFYTNIKTPLDGLNFWYNKIVKSFESLNLIDSSKYINVRFEDFAINNRDFEKNKIINFLSIKNEDQMDYFFNNNIIKEKVSIGKWQNIENTKEFDKKYDEMLLKLADIGIFINKYY
jgi:hypothetical protein